MKKLNHLIEGLQILEKLYGDWVYSFHDGYMFVGSYEPERLTDEELTRLEKLGWFENEESWCVGE
jgi:hypothetical protein